ncbi:MAG: hypothetical protein ABI390_04425 [Daejeonella sp.]
MENHEAQETKNYSLFYILAVICGILTAWVVTGNILFVLLGAILGLLTAGFFVNVLVKNREV